MTPLDAETALISMGLGNVLRGVASRPTKDSAQLARKFRSELLAFMGEGVGKVGDFVTADSEEVDGLLNAEDDAEAARIDKIHALFENPEDADAVLALAGKIVRDLQVAFPRRVWTTLAKVSKDPPEPSAWERFERAWAMATEPQTIMDRVRDGTITEDEAALFQRFYPQTYEVVKSMHDDALAAMKARRGANWDYDSDQDRALRTLLQAPTFDSGLAADYAKAAVPVTLPTSPGAAKPPKVESDALPGQRV